MNQTEFDKVKAHPFHHYLGIKEIDAADEKARIVIPVQEKTLNPSGTFHGGVVYTLCDITAFCALISTMDEGEIGVTNNISIQMLRAARVGQEVIFQAKIIKRGKRLAFLECTAMVGDKIIAKASVTKTLIVLNE